MFAAALALCLIPNFLAHRLDLVEFDPPLSQLLI
jgi:hypothetical protein